MQNAYFHVSAQCARISGQHVCLISRGNYIRMSKLKPGIFNNYRPPWQEPNLSVQCVYLKLRQFTYWLYKQLNKFEIALNVAKRPKAQYRNKQLGHSFEVCVSVHVALRILLAFSQPVYCIFWPIKTLN